MNPNLIDLFKDALNIMRMRFQAAEQYDYGLPVFVAVMLGVGAVNAAMMSPMFGKSLAALGFCVIVAVTRWLVFTRVAAEILRPAKSPRIPFLGYTLACEALVLPSVLGFYVPKMALFLSLWGTWAFWAQAIGLYHISKQSVGKIVGVYLLYFLCSAMLIAVFLAMFVAEGWLDLQVIKNNVETYLHNMPK